MLLQDGIFPAPAVLPQFKKGPVSGKRFLFLRIRINIINGASDVAIVGFDDTMVSHIANPAISTIRQPVERIGSSAADLIIGLIEGKEGINRSVLLDTELIIRESSAV